jgi:two-component system sensor histidine kinase/response regulator
VGTKSAVDCGTSTELLERELLSISGEAEGDRRILVVDDEESLVGALSEFLSLRGYEVETALNARQALALVHEKSFSVVVSDLRLPGMNGVELLEHILDLDPETVVVIMTGYASVQSAVEAMKKGAYDYVVKPFSVHELEKTLMLGLERRKLCKENLHLSHLMRKMVEVDQIKSNIIGTISHEFRTPLMSLRGYLAMLARSADNGVPLGEVEKKWLHAMHDNLGRLEMLILNLLVMTEAKAGDIVIANDRINVTDLVNESVTRFNTLARSKDVRVTVESDAKSPIGGDAEKLVVAFGNLVENAIKFSMESGTVGVTVCETSDPDGVRIAVTDAGIGIPEEKMGHMFESFTQADMTRTRRFNGAGLGLPVAKIIVDAHGGRIDADSKPGRGSTFYVWLPRGNGA